MEQKTYEELVKEIEKKDIEIEEKDIEIENLKLHINALNKIIFGSRRESTPKQDNVVEGIQNSLFGEIEDEEIKEQIEEKTEEIIVHKNLLTKVNTFL